MANTTISMNKIRQILRLYDRCTPKQTIAIYTGLSRTTVIKYITAFEACDVPLKEVDALKDKELEELFGKINDKPKTLSPRMQALYNCFPQVEKELKRTGVTRFLLWQDYISAFPKGFKYTQFCRYFKEWQQKVNPTMHRTHKVGDKLFIDYAGEKLRYTDKQSGKIVDVEVFVAILGASQLTYVEAVPSQQKEDFIAACENAIHYIGGVPAAIVPDNLKAAVTKSHNYEPTLNQTFEDFAEHYGTCVLPARAYRPRDKALVEGAVRIMYTRIYVPINKNTYHSLFELNVAIRELLEAHNNLVLSNRNYSRRMQFEEHERKELMPLPEDRFELKKHFYAKVNKDGHILLGPDRHYYSVPVRFVGKKVKVLYTRDIVEIFSKFERIAIHSRSLVPHAFTTDNSHLSAPHRYSLERSPQTFLERAVAIHDDVRILIEAIVTDEKRHEDQIVRLCEGILGLVKKFGPDRLANACRNAQSFHTESKLYSSIKAMLENNMETQRENLFDKVLPMPNHDNIRGEDYYK
jgi:transposase